MKAKKNLNYFDVFLAKKAYVNGENIMKTLRRQKKLNNNTSKIIEIAYDLQAGSYIRYAIKNHKSENLYTSN